MQITRTPSPKGQGHVYYVNMYDIDARGLTWIKVWDSGEFDCSIMSACLAMELDTEESRREIKKEFNKRRGQRRPSLDFK